MKSVANRGLSQSIVLIALALGVVSWALMGCSKSSQTPETSLPLRPVSNGTATQEASGVAGSEVPKSDATPTVGSTSVDSGSGTGSSDGGSQGAAGGSGSGSTGGSTEVPAQIKRGYVIIKYWNDTVSKAPAGLEIVAGDAVFKPKARVSSEVGRLGPIPLGKTMDLVVYPDGRKGSKVTVSIMVAEDMDANDVDAIHVEIRDDKVRILGNPLVRAEVVASRG